MAIDDDTQALLPGDPPDGPGRCAEDDDDDNAHALLPGDQPAELGRGDEDDDTHAPLPVDQPVGTAHGAQIVLEWNRLSLDLAAEARRGPTVSSRLFAVVNTALFESWALFQPQAPERWSPPHRGNSTSSC